MSCLALGGFKTLTPKRIKNFDEENQLLCANYIAQIDTSVIINTVRGDNDPLTGLRFSRRVIQLSKSTHIKTQNFTSNHIIKMFSSCELSYRGTIKNN